MKLAGTVGRWVSGFGTWLRSLENPNTGLDEWEELLDAPPTSSGMKVSRRTAMKYSAWWRGVNLISGAVAKLPLHTYERTADGRSKAKSHSAYTLLRNRVNPEMAAHTFKQMMTLHALSTGNGFAYIDRDGNGNAIGLYPLDPDRVTVVREGRKIWYVLALGGAGLADEKSELRKLHSAEVFHLRGLGWDGLTGYSLLTLAAESVGLGLAQEKYAAKFFSNAATPAVVLEVANKLDDKTYARLQATWHKVRAGLDSAHKAAILEGGVKVNPLGVSARDSQLIESREFTLIDLANFLGLPPHKLGHSGRTSYGSLEQENQAFLDESLDPWLCAWEAECWMKLLTAPEQAADSHYMEYNRPALVRANMAQRAAFYRAAVGRPWMAMNEARSAENMNSAADGDQIWSPLNMAPSGSVQDDSAGVTSESGARGGVDLVRLGVAIDRVLQDSLRRGSRRLAIAAGKAAKGNGSLQGWSGGEHRAVIAQMVGPAVEMLRAAGVTGGDPGAWADELVAGFEASLADTRAADVAAACEGLTDRLPSAVIDRMLSS